MAAENSFTLYFNELASSTLMKYRHEGEFYDNVFKDNPTFFWFHEKGRKRQKSGGERIVIPIQHAASSAVGSYSGYETFDITPQDNQTAVYYNWKQFAGAITIDGLTRFQNADDSQIVDLLESKTQECENSIAERLNKMLWKVTPATRDIISIPAFIPLAPATTDAASPGGLSGTTKTYWRNQAKQSSATTWKGFLIEAKNLYNTCSNGGGQNGRGAPDLSVCNQETYEYFENYMTEQERFVGDDLGVKAKSVGFQNIKFKRSNVFWDEHIPDAYGDGTTGYDWDNTSVTYGSLYFLNTNYIYYVTAEGIDLAPQPFQTPVGQDASISAILHYHALCMSVRRKHGVLYKISKSLTS